MMEPTIQLPAEQTDEQILNRVRLWLELLAIDDYAAAVQAVQWPGARSPDGSPISTVSPFDSNTLTISGTGWAYRHLWQPSTEFALGPQ